MILRLLSQILIKLHAGREWGFDDEHVRKLAGAAGEMATKLDPGRYPDYE